MPVARPPLPLRPPPARARFGRARPPREMVPRLVGWGLVGLVAAAAVWWGLRHWDWRAVPAAIAELDTPLSLTAMAVLPLAGFPIGAVYLVAGIKFGPVWGGVVVASVTAFHLVAGHFVARHLLRRPIEGFLSRRRHRLPQIPEGDDRAVAAVVALAPGLPYSLRTYFLALTGVPLPVYLPICLGIYVLRAYVTIYFGGWTTNPQAEGFWILAAIYVLKLAVCGELIRRIYRRHRLRKAALPPAPEAG